MNTREKQLMKFVLHSGSRDFLVCDSCGGTDFKLARNRKLSSNAVYSLFLFYECPNCAGAGFWAHMTSIDKDRQIGIALARCKPRAAAAASKPHSPRGRTSRETNSSRQWKTT
jgi:hypothetical protein